MPHCAFHFRSGMPADRLEWWGAPLAPNFPPRLQRLAQLAGKRWGMRNPSPADVMEQALGERWMEENPGLASLITSYQIGGER